MRDPAFPSKARIMGLQGSAKAWDRQGLKTACLKFTFFICLKFRTVPALLDTHTFPCARDEGWEHSLNFMPDFEVFLCSLLLGLYFCNSVQMLCILGKARVKRKMKEMTEPRMTVPLILLFYNPSQKLTQWAEIPCWVLSWVPEWARACVGVQEERGEEQPKRDVRSLLWWEQTTRWALPCGLTCPWSSVPLPTENISFPCLQMQTEAGL